MTGISHKSRLNIKAAADILFVLGHVFAFEKCGVKAYRSKMAVTSNVTAIFQYKGWYGGIPGADPIQGAKRILFPCPPARRGLRHGAVFQKGIGWLLCKDDAFLKYPYRCWNNKDSYLTANC